MNMNSNMLRSGPMAQNPALLGMNAAFMQNPGQQQLGQNPMNMSGGGIGPNPTMSMLQSNNAMMQQNPRLFMQATPAQQQQQQQQRQLQQLQQQGMQGLHQQGAGPMMRPQGQGGPQSMQAMQAGAAHMAGLNPQIQGMVGVGFPGQGGMVNPQGNPAVRRVVSQPQLGGGGGGGVGMNPAVTGGMSMGMSNLNPSMLPAATQHQIRVRQQQHIAAAANLARVQAGNNGGPIMNMAMNPGLGGGAGAQGQIMSSLQQPGSMVQQQHPMFSNGAGLHQQSQGTPTPRSTPLPPSAHPMNPSGPNQHPGTRASMTPDNSNAMNFANYAGMPQFSSPGGMVHRGPQQGAQYPFQPQPPTTPPIQDPADSPMGAMISQGTPSSQARGGFQPTPAQQLQMSGGTNGVHAGNGDPFNPPHFPMPPPSTIPPPRPPSLTPALGSHAAMAQAHMQLSQQQQQGTTNSQQSQQPMARSGTPGARASPLPPDHPSRPQSRLQSQPQHTNVLLQQQQQQQQHPGQAPPSRVQTPRSAQMAMAMNGGTGGGPGPASQGQQQGPQRTGMQPHQRQQTPVSGMGMPANAQGMQLPQSQLNPGQQASNQQQQHQQQQQQQPGRMMGPQPPQAQGHAQQGAGGVVGGGRQPPPGTIAIPPPGGIPSTVSAVPAKSQPPPSQPGADQSGVHALGHGKGLAFLLQFTGMLGRDEDMIKARKHSQVWWEGLIKEFWNPSAVFRFTLWKDSMKAEAKPFSLGTSLLPRFFLVTTQSGVESMNLSLDGARERFWVTGHAIIECVNATWTWRYTNGYIVTLRGPLTVRVVATVPQPDQGVTEWSGPSRPSGGIVFKIEDWEFDAMHHTQYISCDNIAGDRLNDPRQGISNGPPEAWNNSQQEDSPHPERHLDVDDRVIPIRNASIPGEPVNAFGVPQATMRCLELAESISAMEYLMEFAHEKNLGALDALHQYAVKCRQEGYEQPEHSDLAWPSTAFRIPSPPPEPNYYKKAPNYTPAPPETIPGMLYTSAPPSITNPSNQGQQIIPPPPQATITNSPRNASTSTTSSPQKQHKTIPTVASGSSQASAASPSVSSGAGGTPALPNTSLKRKQTSDAMSSPTTANNEGPPPKRPPRKRGRTNTASGAG